MARAQKLKVFRMTVGFHDAFVAAPTKKAAAEAWGTDMRVFAHKEAELVTDPILTRAPLANPGKVIKRLRGTASEQLAALDVETRSERPAKPDKPQRPKSRPSGAALAKAEAALAEAEARQRAERDQIGARESALRRERQAMAAKHARELDRLAARKEKARESYEEALRRWGLAS